MVAKQWLALALASLIGWIGGDGCAYKRSPGAEQRCNRNEQFVWIPEGEFSYGSDRPERDYAYQISALAIAQASGNPTAESIERADEQLRRNRWFDREPQQQRRSLPGFCLQRNLLTQADYQTFVQSTGHRFPHISADDYQTQGFLVHPYETVMPYLWDGQQSPHAKVAHPVVLVSYNDALAYAQWKGKQDRVTYRLPTAEEWEKAARGVNGDYFPWGNDWLDNATNWARTADEGLITTMGHPGTSAIATFPLSQSPYGVNDMAGNVFEYTSSLRHYPSGTRVVMKGCSWDDWPGFCRAAYEHTRPPESRHILFGFRLVQD